jgi:hypothetical protein
MILFENGSNSFAKFNLCKYTRLSRIREQRWWTGKRSFAVQAAAFFTPNGDGANDYWNLKGLNGSIYKTRKYSFRSIRKLLKQLNPYGWLGWKL